MVMLIGSDVFAAQSTCAIGVETSKLGAARDSVIACRVGGPVARQACAGRFLMGSTRVLALSDAGSCCARLIGQFGVCGAFSWG